MTLPPKVANNPNLEVTKQPNQNLNGKQGDGMQVTGAVNSEIVAHRQSGPTVPTWNNVANPTQNPRCYQG